MSLSSCLCASDLHVRSALSLQHTTGWEALALADHIVFCGQQVPCSWGVFYSPTVWKEFRQYLRQRLAEGTSMKVRILCGLWIGFVERAFTLLLLLRGSITGQRAQISY